MIQSKQVRATTVALWGIDARPVEVCALLQNGPPQIEILGLPPSAGRESRERVRAALRSSGYDLPTQSLVIKLAPADLTKEAGFFDLAIALALLASCGRLPQEALEGRLICGELELDGSVRSVRGGLAIAELGHRLGSRELLLPAANGPETAALATVRVIGLRSLLQAVSHVTGAEPLTRVPAPPLPAQSLAGTPDLSEVRGQEAAKRALEIAAAGGHNLLFVGGPQAATPCNAAMGPEPLGRFCAVDAAGRALLEAAFERLGLSARALDSVLKVARTIADLAGSDSIRSSHLAEAIQYRRLDRFRAW